MRSNDVKSSSIFTLNCCWILLCLSARSSNAQWALGHVHTSPHPDGDAEVFIGYRLIMKGKECDTGQERKIYSSFRTNDCFWNDWDGGSERHRCDTTTGHQSTQTYVERCARGCAWSTINGVPVKGFIVKPANVYEDGRCWCETCHLRSSSGK